MVAFAELTPARVLNRPSKMASNNSKPYQARLLAAGGFRVPPTLVTTDPAALQAFRELHGEVIYKSTSGVRSVVSRLSDRHEGRLDDIRWCPTQFQRFVPGRDFRVHVVGDQVFATAVISGADDYRYARQQGSSADLFIGDLPEEILDRCRRASRALDLPLTGLDLRYSEDGEWYCFEANPSPCFTFYEERTGQPIAAAIADLLLSPHQ